MEPLVLIKYTCQNRMVLTNDASTTIGSINGQGLAMVPPALMFSKTPPLAMVVAFDGNLGYLESFPDSFGKKVDISNLTKLFSNIQQRMGVANCKESFLKVTWQHS